MSDINFHALVERQPRPHKSLIRAYFKGSPDDGLDKAIERAAHDELYTKLSELRYNEKGLSTDQRLDAVLDLIMQAVPYNE